MLAASFDLHSTLPTVATMMASWFRGYCLIDLMVDGRLERVAAAHWDPDKQALMEEMRAFSPGDDSRSPMWRVIRLAAGRGVQHDHRRSDPDGHPVGSACRGAARARRHRLHPRAAHRRRTSGRQPDDRGDVRRAVRGDRCAAGRGAGVPDGDRGRQRAGVHRSARRQPVEGRVPGDRVARAADAAQCHARLDVAAAGGRG